MGKITVGKYAGFCFGVRRSVDRVYELAEKFKGCRLFTTGELIHNPSIIEELKNKGIYPANEDEIKAVCEEAESGDERETIVVIRTHGEKRDITERLLACAALNQHFHVEDCTCPYGQTIHKIVQDNTSENTLTIIMGDLHHPEVKGICSYCAGEYAVCDTSDKCLGKIKLCNIYKEKIILVAQTTQKLSEWRKLQENIQKVCTNAIIFDTICNVTESRQTEADEMSQMVDLMIVIGGRNSSNTNKLYMTAKQNLDNTYLVENESELPLDKLNPHFNVGITAGASTPSGIIEEVKKIMTENMMKDAEIAGEDFAGMLEQSLKTLNTGDTVTGIITSISSGEIHVDLSAKATGIIPASELSDSSSADIAEKYHVGDEIEAIVIKVSDMDGIATLSRRKIENVINWKHIVEAYEAGEVLEGKIIDAVKGGVIISLFNMRVFIPASHTGVSKDTDLSTIVGTVQKVKIIEINEARRRAVASVRVVKRDERRKLEAAFWDSIEDGKVYTGKVKSLTSYGAFVDLGGVDGMVHSSELSWLHISHPSDVVSVGDEITVYVKSFDRDAKRISLGYKTEETNPWNIFMSQYTIGDVANVKIVSILAFGAFAEIVPGVDGLIHVSQISLDKIASPSDVLQVGQTVDAKIVDIDYDNHKISLSIRALLEDDEENIDFDNAEEDDSLEEQ